MKLRTARLWVLVMALLAELASASSPDNADGSNSTNSQRDVCASLSGAEECLWARLALLAERATASNRSARLGGVSLVAVPVPEDAGAGGSETRAQSRGARTLTLLEEARAEASGQGRLRRLRELAKAAVLRLLRSRALRVKLPDARTFRGAQRRLKKMLYPFLAGIVLKAAASLPLILSVLLGVGLKALLASNVALAITSALALRTFLFSDSGGGAKVVSSSAVYQHAYHEPLYHHAAEESHAHPHYAHPEAHFGHSAHAGDLGVAAGAAQPYPYGRAMPGVDRLGWTPVAADRISEDNWSPLDMGLWRRSIPYDQTDNSMSHTAGDYEGYSLTSLPTITTSSPALGAEMSTHQILPTAAEGTESVSNLEENQRD